MPIAISSNLVPKANAHFALMEDIYLKGGYRSVGTESDLQTLNSYTMKEGMLVSTVDTAKFYTLKADLTTWVEIPIGAGSGSRSTYEVVCTPAGVIDMPYEGTARRYFDFDYEFKRLSIAVAAPSVGDVTVEFYKNALTTAGASAVLPASMEYKAFDISLSVVRGDFITLKMTGTQAYFPVIVLR